MKTKFLRDKIVRAAALALIAVTAVFALLACAPKDDVKPDNKPKTLEDLASDYTASVASVKTVTSTVVYKDGETAVYSAETVYAFTADDKANVTETVTELDMMAFENKQTTSAAVKDVKKTDMVAVNLKGSLMDVGYTVSNEEVSGNVSGEENIKQFVGDSIPVFGELTFSVKFENGKVSLVKYSFVTERQRNAEVTYVYTY